MGQQNQTVIIHNHLEKPKAKKQRKRKATRKMPKKNLDFEMGRSFSVPFQTHNSAAITPANLDLHLHDLKQLNYLRDAPKHEILPAPDIHAHEIHRLTEQVNNLGRRIDTAEPHIAHAILAHEKALDEHQKEIRKLTEPIRQPRMEIHEIQETPQRAAHEVRPSILDATHDIHKSLSKTEEILKRLRPQFGGDQESDGAKVFLFSDDQLSSQRPSPNGSDLETPPPYSPRPDSVLGSLPKPVEYYEATAKRGRGRPKGAKNKPKEEPTGVKTRTDTRMEAAIQDKRVAVRKKKGKYEEGLTDFETERE